MKKLDKRKITGIKVELNEGERTLLFSNESDQRSPFWGFLDTSSDNVSEGMVENPVILTTTIRCKLTTLS